MDRRSSHEVALEIPGRSPRDVAVEAGGGFRHRRRWLAGLAAPRLGGVAHPFGSIGRRLIGTEVSIQRTTHGPPPNVAGNAWGWIGARPERRRRICECLMETRGADRLGAIGARNGLTNRRGRGRGAARNGRAAVDVPTCLTLNAPAADRHTPTAP